MAVFRFAAAVVAAVAAALLAAAAVLVDDAAAAVAAAVAVAPVAAGGNRFAAFRWPTFHPRPPLRCCSVSNSCQLQRARKLITINKSFYSDLKWQFPSTRC